MIQLPIALLPALPHWVWPSAGLWPWVGVVAVTAVSAHYCLARAFRLADATVVVPMDFLRLPLIAVIGFAFYGEALTVWVFVGALIVFFATWLNLKSVTKLRFGGQRLRIARASGSQVHPLGALLAPEPGGLDHRIRGMSEQVGLRLVQRCQCLLRRVRHDEMGETLKVTPHGPLERGMAQSLPLPRPPASTSDGSATSHTHTPLAARRVPIAHSNLGC